jgi:hypothetical protein
VYNGPIVEILEQNIFIMTGGDRWRTAKENEETAYTLLVLKTQVLSSDCCRHTPPTVHYNTLLLSTTEQTNLGWEGFSGIVK